MSPENIEQVRCILRDAGVRESDIDWMARSCPSIERALEFYPPVVCP